jgi:hypothetical protein
MSDTFTFAGTVVRVEGDGFGVVRFDEPHSANTHGFFSASTMDVELPIAALKPGLHVVGTAESGNTEFAEVKTLQVE